jgi:antitoxin component YwqK of YwqJK toxin-antitoxin module
MKPSYKPLLLVSLLLSSFYSCSDNQTKSTHLIDEISEDNVSLEPKLIHSSASERKIKELFEDFERPIDSYPRITEQESIKDIEGIVYRDGIQEPFSGRLIKNHDNGQVALSSTYLNGLLHGLQVKFFEDGQRSLEAIFDKGILSGVKTRWWRNGLVREEEYWDDGKYNGRKLWDETGRLIREELLGN